MEEQRKKSNGWKWAAAATILLAGMTGVLVMVFGGENRNEDKIGIVSMTPTVTATEAITMEPERTVVQDVSILCGSDQGGIPTGSGGGHQKRKIRKRTNNTR